MTSGSHQIALYWWDIDGSRRSFVQVLDGDTNAVLENRGLGYYATNPYYMVWNITGHVKFVMNQNSGANVYLNGFFFDPATQSAAPSGTLPPVTSGLQWVYDARYLNGMSLADGASVVFLPDISSNHYNAASNASSGMVYHTAGGFNGGPRFTTSNVRFDISEANKISSTSAHTVFVVYKLTSASSDQNLFSGTCCGVNTFEWRFGFSNGGSTRMYGIWNEGIGGGGSGTALLDANWHMADVVYTNTTLAFRIDQATDTVIAGSSGQQAYGPPQTLFATSAGENFNADILFMAYYNTQLTTLQIQQVEQYLAPLTYVPTITPILIAER